MDHGVRLLGIAEASDAPAMAERMARLEGPAVRLHPLGPVVALLQPAGPPPRALLLGGDRLGLLQTLRQVQQRLEAACQTGPFLPCDPGAALCPAEGMSGLLEVAAEDLPACLRHLGWHQQWDVVLRWDPRAVLEAQRASLAGLGRAALADAAGQALQNEVALRRAALHAALAPQVIAIAPATPAAGDAETGATVLIPAGTEARIEGALGCLPAFASAGATADLRGPLPGLSFAALRILRSDPAEIRAAWLRLGLPDRIDRDELPRRWRDLAFRLHPDRSGADGTAMAEAGTAYRLLRQVFARMPERPIDCQALMSLSGHHLALPDLPVSRMMEAA